MTLTNICVGHDTILPIFWRTNLSNFRDCVYIYMYTFQYDQCIYSILEIISDQWKQHNITQGYTKYDKNKMTYYVFNISLKNYNSNVISSSAFITPDLFSRKKLTFLATDIHEIQFLDIFRRRTYSNDLGGGGIRNFHKGGHNVTISKKKMADISWWRTLPIVNSRAFPELGKNTSNVWIIFTGC